MKKYVVLCASLLVSASSFAQELTNFEEIKSAIIHGRTIHVTTNFLKCTTPSNQMTEMTIVGAFSPTEVAVVNDKIGASSNHFTLNNPAYLNKPIYEFTRYTITSENKVTLATQVLDAVDFKLLGSPTKFDCAVGDGVRVYVD